MNNITLVVQETQYHKLAEQAVINTLRHIDVKEVLTFSNKSIVAGERLVSVEPFPSVEAYCQYMLTGWLDHVTTDWVLFVQWDAMATGLMPWDQKFLDYDYIGAPWPWYQDNQSVGNGGFSFRSRKLLQALQDPRIIMVPNDSASMYEDRAIGIGYRPLLENEYQIRYAPRNLAAEFSYELGNYQPSFGFHGVWNIIRCASPDTVDFYIKNMDYTGWNHYKWHHVLFELTRANAGEYFDFVLEKMQTYSPELVNPVIEWLAKEDYTRDIF